jgi:hypothetical protein
MKSKYVLVALAPLVVACTEVRDISDRTDLMLSVEGSWAASLGKTEMYDATVLLNHADGEQSKAFLSRPNGVHATVRNGEYDVMVFNGIMESEENTNLDHIGFRGTDRHGTFEVYSVEGTRLARLSRAEGVGEDEWVVSNNMEIFTFAHHQVTVDGDDAVYKKYSNGDRVNEDVDYIVAQEIYTVPQALSFRFQVVLTNVVNPTGARSAAGALRGFMGSVFVPTTGARPRPGTPASHHLPLTAPATGRLRTRADGTDVGTLVTQQFVSFGPPLPAEGQSLPERGEYFFDPSFGLYDGTEHKPGPIDITAQVNAIIERQFDHYGGRHISNPENLFVITIDDEVFLPPVSGGEGLPVEVEEWPDEEEEIIVWI